MMQYKFALQLPYLSRDADVMYEKELTDLIVNLTLNFFDCTFCSTIIFQGYKKSRSVIQV